jgi:hypothetical protein
MWLPPLRDLLPEGHMCQESSKMTPKVAYHSIGHRSPVWRPTLSGWSVLQHQSEPPPTKLRISVVMDAAHTHHSPLWCW